MRILSPLLVTLAVATAAQPTLAQPSLGAFIPRQFHGHWAPSPRACHDRGPSTQVVTIDRRGWTSFEEGARVTRYTQMLRGVHHFRIISFGGADETPGTLALRLERGRLAMTETVRGRSTNKSLVRCR